MNLMPGVAHPTKLNPTRNPSPDSIRIGAPHAYVACTVRGAKVLVFSGVYVLVNLVIDVVYMALDPRIRY